MTDQRTPLVEFQGVSKNYGPKPAVVGLTFSLFPGEVFAFLGPNGAGKTTTIKMMTGLLKPTAGTIRIDGAASAFDSAAARRILSYVPDMPHVYEKLSGREFLEFVRELYGLSGPEADADVARLVDTFEMRDFLDDLAETYSHGMRQRLAFAGALLHRPKVLVLDEPMVGLDPKSMRIVKDLLRREAAAGMSVFMSTHTLAIAEELADRVGIIQRGRLIRCGTLDEIRAEFAVGHTLEDFFLQITREGGEE
jgi:ABC-2 type transport system ATP-binding protein